MNREIVGQSVLDAAFKVRTVLGPGLLESVYESALSRELSKRGQRVDRQRLIPVFYDGELLDDIGFRADVIVDELVLVELKSVSTITDVFKKITLSYLRFIPLQLGFLLNFNEAHLKNGLTRIVNGAEGKPVFS